MSSKEISIKTLVNELPVDPEKSVLPIQLVGDRVIIEPIKPDEYLSKEAGIARPAAMKEEFRKGKVMGIGGAEYGTSIPTHLKVGLIVHYWHQGAIEFQIDKKKYDVVRASDVFMYL